MLVNVKDKRFRGVVGCGGRDRRGDNLCHSHLLSTVRFFRGARSVLRKLEVGLSYLYGRFLWNFQMNVSFVGRFLQYRARVFTSMRGELRDKG